MIIKRQGNYPAYDPSLATQYVILFGKKEILVRTYETSRSIQLYFGGRKNWCIHIDLIKGPHAVPKPLGYFIKIRYDELCTLNHTIDRDGDRKQLIKIILQYVADHYPTVTHLAFNDLSTRSYDNQTDVNLAVMTVFYTGGTWYQKHIGAIIAPESMEYLENHMRYYREAKHIPWDIMSDTITDHRHRVNDMESLYYSANTWEEFFQSLYNRLGGIRPFCLFVSEWIDRFIAKYFNNLRGLTYWMPVKAINLLYRIRPFTVDICSVQKHPSTSLFYPILSRNS